MVNGVFLVNMVPCGEWGVFGEYGPLVSSLKYMSDLLTMLVSGRSLSLLYSYTYGVLIRKEVRPVRGAPERDLVGYLGLCMEIQNSINQVRFIKI